MTQIDRFHWNVELPIQTLSWAVGADLPATLTDDPAEDSDAQNEPRDIDLEKSSNETRGFALLAKWATEASGVGMAECGTVALTACGGEGSCASCPKRAMGIAKLLTAEGMALCGQLPMASCPGSMEGAVGDMAACGQLPAIACGLMAQNPPAPPAPPTGLPAPPPGAREKAKQKERAGRGVEGNPMDTMDKFNWDSLPLPGLAGDQIPNSPDDKDCGQHYISKPLDCFDGRAHRPKKGQNPYWT
jgi:hypothetical protein